MTDREQGSEAVDERVRRVLAAGNREQARALLARAQADAGATGDAELASHYCSFRASLLHADSHDEAAIAAMREAILLSPELPYRRVALARLLARSSAHGDALNELAAAEEVISQTTGWTYLLQDIRDIRQELATGGAV